MRKAKGSMFIMFVKAIRADKSGAFDKYLTDSDREVISQVILQSGWYPYETYKNCFKAVAEVMANNDPKTLIEWGREYGEATMSSIYKTVVKKDDVVSAMDTYQNVFKSQFDFGEIKCDVTGDNELEITISGFDKDLNNGITLLLAG